VDSGSSARICSYDPVAKVATYGSLPTPSGSGVRSIVPTPDGKRFFLTSDEDGVGVFDAKTVKMLGQIPPPNSYVADTLPNVAAGAVMSLDGKTLYLIEQTTGVIGAYDTTRLVQTGWVPSFLVDDPLTTIILSAIDETGLIVGPTGHGVAFIDGSSVKAKNPTTIYGDAGAEPRSGPLTGGTELTDFLFGWDPTPNMALSQLYVGNHPGADASFVATGYGQPTAQVTTPPSSISGAVDLSIELSDGGAGVAPEAFSYGPTILEVVPNAATEEGGQTGAIIGYGFGNTTSEIQVTVGGRPAPVTVVHNLPPIVPYPFPANALQFTIPPGTAGTAVDVTVTTPSGTAAAAGAFHYSAAVESYPVNANLQAGIYDARRNLYYFADQAKIQVFSKSAGKWLAPITLPKVGSKTQLLAISESPDGTKLAVSDFGDQCIYVLNPDRPAGAKSYPMPVDWSNISLLAPSGLAITDAGVVYFMTADIGGTGTPAFHRLNTATGSIVDLGMLYSGGPADKFARVLLSPDGSKLYGNDGGWAFWLDTSNDQISNSSWISSWDYSDMDLAVSADGSTVDNGGIFADPSLNPEMETDYVDWETWFPSAVIGQKLNQDGSVLFQPLTDGIDLMARNTGHLLYRVQIPVSPADVYDSLVVAEGKDTLAVITSGGVSLVDLSSLPIPTQDTLPFMDATHTEVGRSTGTRIAAPIKGPSSNRFVRPRVGPQLKRQVAHPS